MTDAERLREAAKESNKGRCMVMLSEAFMLRVAKELVRLAAIDAVFEQCQITKVNWNHPANNGTKAIVLVGILHDQNLLPEGE